MFISDKVRIFQNGTSKIIGVLLNAFQVFCLAVSLLFNFSECIMAADSVEYAQTNTTDNVQITDMQIVNKKVSTRDNYVVATVDNIPITLLDSTKRAMLLKKITPSDILNTKNPHDFNREVVLMLIDEIIITEEAEKLGISVSEAIMQEAFVNMAESNQMHAKQFLNVLETSGIDIEEFKRYMKAQLLFGKVIRYGARANIFVSDKEVADNVDNINYSAKKESVQIREGLYSAKLSTYIPEYLETIRYGYTISTKTG